MEDLYVVKYSYGDLSGKAVETLFVTNKEYAEKYTKRFNILIYKLKDRNKQFQDENGLMKDEFVDDYWENWFRVDELIRCWCEPIKFRK